MSLGIGSRDLWLVFCNVVCDGYAFDYCDRYECVCQGDVDPCGFEHLSNR